MMAGGSFRAIWLLSLICAVAVSACRELVAAPEQTVEGSISILVLDLDGEPLTRGVVDISSHDFVPYPGGVSWDGSLDENGFVYPNIPQGSYRIEIRPNRSSDPNWERPGVDLGDHQVTLDPRPTVQYGRLTLPADLPATYVHVEFEITIQQEMGSYTSRTRVLVGEDGNFTFIWPVEGDYRTSVSISGAYAQIEEKLALPAPDSLSLVWEPLRLDATLKFGDTPLPLGEVTVEARAPHARSYDSVPVVGSTISFWANPGTGTLRITPTGGMPFLGQTVFVEFGTSEPIEVDLGEHLGEFRFVASDGSDVFGGRLELRSASTGTTGYFNAAGDQLQVYLRSGEYLLFARNDAYDDIEQIVTITQDTTITFMMEPESDLAP